MELRDQALEFSEPPAPVSGGFDTRIFAFRLKGARPAGSGVGPSAAGPLILRLLGPQHDPARARRERAIQNAVADLGYPAPRVLWASADVRHLGGAFLVMERRAGRPLSKERRVRAGAILANAQLRLHALDADRVLEALDREGPPVHRGQVSFDAYLGRLESLIADGALDGLRPAMRWLLERRPPAPPRPSICHGDFHPLNLLWDGAAVAGVLDWPNTLVGDRSFDVASTIAILALTPIELWGIPPPLRWMVAIARPMLVRSYLAGYRRGCPLHPETLAYYEAASAMRHLVRAGQYRRRADPSASNPLDDSSFADNLAARFARIAGVTPALPARRVWRRPGV